MNTNTAFIVRYRKEGELFDSVRVVTEGLLKANIKAKYNTMFDKPVKEKYFTQLAGEIMKRFSGGSVSEKEYDTFLHDWSVMLYDYTNISILDFGEILQTYNKQQENATNISHTQQ